MRIGHITPWGIPHGIAVYAEKLVRGLWGHVDPVVVGFELDANGQADIEIEAVLEYLQPAELVHVQYADGLYGPVLAEVVQALRQVGKKVLLTAHGKAPDFLVDHMVVHQMSGQTYKTDQISVIPLGTKVYDNAPGPANWRSVCCLGSRSNPDDVTAALDHLGGGVLSVVDGHDWLVENLLVEKILRSQVIVLNYKDGSENSLSKYAALAMGLRRPLIVSGSQALAHVRDLPGVAMADDVEHISVCLDYTFGNYPQALKYVDDRLALLSPRKLLEVDVLEAHLQLYQKIIGKST